MYAKTNEAGRSITKEMACGYTKYIEQKFEKYAHMLTGVSHALGKGTVKYENVTQLLNQMMMMDSAIVSMWVVNTDDAFIAKAGLNQDLAKGIRNVLAATDRSSPGLKSAIVEGDYLVIYRAWPAKEALVTGLTIDLRNMHNQFVRKDLYRYMYQVILNSKLECVYHPEYRFVGKKWELPDNIYTDGRFRPEQLDKIHHSHSVYLNMPAYKEYSLISMAGEQGVIISVSPGLEIGDIFAEQEKSLFLLFILFAILLIGILVYGILNWKKEFEKRARVEQQNLGLMLKSEKQKSETISIRLELLRSGLNSHFLFNSLGTLKALLNENNAVARGFVSDLSRLYRYQLQIEGEKMVSLKDEFGFTQCFVEIINLRLGNAVQLDINNLEEFFGYRILPVSLQLLVDNCIKHNVVAADNPLVIAIWVENEMLVVENEIKPKVTWGESNGKGLANLQTRYSLLTNRDCYFNKGERKFKAMIPLLKEK